MEFIKKPVQLVRHMHEVLPGYRKQAAKGKKYMVQTKYDGVFGFMIHEQGQDDQVGCWQMYGRTGKKLSNCESLEKQFEDAHASHDDVFIGEIVCPGLSLEELSGILNPNRTKPVEDMPRLHFVMHDLIPYERFLDGHCPTYAKLRFRLLAEHYAGMADKLPDCKVLRCLYDLSEERIRLVAEGLIEAGHEGVVIKREDADWKAGRKNHESMKIVRGCDYDLMCVGVEEGKGKRAGMVANALCVWRKFGDPKGELVHLPVDLGRGFTDARRIELWEDQSKIVGHVLEVHALQVGSQGSLRLPKVNSIRVDKGRADL